MNRRSSESPTLEEAKANFAAAVDAVDPFRAAKKRPALALGTTVALGIFMGYAGLRLMKKTIFQPPVAYALLKRFFL